jgi:hypothetical protein
MAVFSVRVANQIYCEIEIEDTHVKNSPNLIDNIVMHEGVGIAIPTLTVFFNDQQGSMQKDLNLSEGTKCAITIVKDGKKDRRVKRKFRLWSMAKSVSAIGPHYKVVFILDIPKWITGVYCEAIDGTSDRVMSFLSASAGMNYSGPTTVPDDRMKWLNINTTRSNFSEDVAMRGFVDISSCMSRVVTLNNELRYKNLFEELKSDPDATLVLNSNGEGKPNPTVVMRETVTRSHSSLTSHWFNYGSTQFGHSLDKLPPEPITRLTAPLLGDSLPLNAEVVEAISDSRGSSISYTGFDCGKAPHDDFNMHEFYERALYQNLRGLGLFSEHVTSMTDNFTGLSTFDCIEYHQKEVNGNIMEDTVIVNGKYLISGKQIRIKNGHHYSEVFNLFRPYATSLGKTSMVRAPDSGSSKAKANAGDINLVKEQDVVTSVESNAEIPNTADVGNNPTIVNMDNTAKALVEYDKTNPALPDTVTSTQGTLSVNSTNVQAQTNLAKALDDSKASNDEFSAAIKGSAEGGDIEDMVTVKRIPAPIVANSANTAVQATLENEGLTADTANNADKSSGVNPSHFKEISTPMEKIVFDRFRDDKGMDALTSREMNSILTPVTGEQLASDVYVTDPQNGGTHAQDFIVDSIIPPTVDGSDSVSGTDYEKKKGTNFVFPAKKFGLGREDVEVTPNVIAKFTLDFIQDKKDPEKYLREKGAQSYLNVFGTMLPYDAKEVVERVEKNSTTVTEQYSEDEVLVGHPTKTAEESGFKKIGGVFKKVKDTTGLDPNITLDTNHINNSVTNEIKGDKNSTGHSKVFDFRFGEQGVGPLVEKVHNKERVTPQDQNEATYDIITTNRERVSWASFTKMGSSESKKQAEANPSGPQPGGTPFDPYPDDDYVPWSYPDSERPVEVIAEGNGSAYSMPDTKV